jgi:hypothetical protein
LIGNEVKTPAPSSPFTPPAAAVAPTGPKKVKGKVALKAPTAIKHRSLTLRDTLHVSALIADMITCRLIIADKSYSMEGDRWREVCDAVARIAPHARESDPDGMY